MKLNLPLFQIAGCGDCSRNVFRRLPGGKSLDGQFKKRMFTLNMAGQFHGELVGPQVTVQSRFGTMSTSATASVRYWEYRFSFLEAASRSSGGEV